MHTSTSGTVSTQEARRPRHFKAFIGLAIGFTAANFAYQWVTGQQAWDLAFDRSVANVIALAAAFAVLAPRR